MSSPSISPSPGRRHDLDWIRVGAFILLILYHVGMFYVPWDWHVKSGHEVEGLMPVMLLTNPWRLTLLFLISGAATRFLADSLAVRGAGAARLAGSRTLRLLPPLVFAMFVIVPPQSYYEIVEAVAVLAPQPDAYHNAFTADFWVRYATASGNWCGPDGDCLITPTWNHMWFVAYLFVYSLLLALILAVAGRRFRALGGVLERALSGWGLLIWPIVFLAGLRLSPLGAVPVTHALVDDWYNHAFSLTAFLFGFLTARSEVLRQTFIRLRWPALGLALAAWAGWAAYVWTFRADGAVPPDQLRTAMRVVYAADQWAFIAAILGFGARWLNHGGPVLRYLSVGVFPFYIAHQTVTVVAGHHLAKQGLPVVVEAGLLIAATAAGCLVAYEVARRIGWLGLLLGVKPERRTAGVQAANRPPLAA